ncbi:folliculin-interacting protein 2 isoform X2 [Trichogramma pretiosum]|uniref:folliculin-interacting protein 2 isoform X2 n=1 Tax=Trichogramma pretiosum TaxID=7493 RepID=UPI0006C9BDBC|nr:folliculin-interacting protein 2 isoform X2 [Trichogramma pretiosum]
MSSSPCSTTSLIAKFWGVSKQRREAAAAAATTTTDHCRQLKQLIATTTAQPSSSSAGGIGKDALVLQADHGGSSDRSNGPSQQQQQQQQTAAAPTQQDRVRILLFRECEWRGRKLLFDSVALEKRQQQRRCPCNGGSSSSSSETEANNGKTSNHKSSPGRQQQHRKASTNEADASIGGRENGKLLSEDISLLGEMIFGSVAMTYRGTSFKIHEMKSSGCILCTKVFPFTEHTICKQSSNNRQSNETLSTAMTNNEANSSNSSLRTSSSATMSRPDSLNVSWNSLSPPATRNDSYCSSTGSGWDIEVPPFGGSSHSLDGSNGSSGSNSSSSVGGSLTSLRRRWQRVLGASLSRSESEDFFGASQQSSFDNSNGACGGEQHRRHKTRLGLAMLIQLPGGHERAISDRLMEHAALLEGSLDCLRHACVEGHGPGLVGRLYRSSHQSCCTLKLLRRLLDPRDGGQQRIATLPLLWHELLLNSSMPADLQSIALRQSLQRMSRLLDELDTKSTNFFLSTIVTAVLTHHLGWVHTAPPQHNRKLLESLSQQYSCNPLWAQLNDLYGAIGTPARISHTVIASGQADKCGLVDSILNFLSYFLRSGLVEKREESRCSAQEDVQEACAILERNLRNNPLLQEQQRRSVRQQQQQMSCAASTSSGSSSYKRVTPQMRARNQHLEEDEDEVDFSSVVKDNKLEIVNKPEVSAVNNNNTNNNNNNNKRMMLKRSGTIHESIDTYEGSSSTTTTTATTRFEKSDYEVGVRELEDEDEDSEKPSSQVKIIVSNEDERGGDEVRKASPVLAGSHMAQQDDKLSELEPKATKTATTTTTAAAVTAGLRRQKLMFESLESHSKAFDEQSSLFFPPSLGDDLASKAQSQPTQVYFTLGDVDEKPSSTTPQQMTIRERLQSSRKCRCSYTFSRVPSTSAELPEGILRKILQRNFPESSKNMEPAGAQTGAAQGSEFCLKCHRGFDREQLREQSQEQGRFENGKLLLETPTNATELLRGCGNSSRSRITRSNSLEALIEASCIIELPMPRSKKVPAQVKKGPSERTGFTTSLMGNWAPSTNTTDAATNSDYTWGMVAQGFTKKQQQQSKTDNDKKESSSPDYKEKEWWWSIREGLRVEVTCPIVDQPVSEALCILGDLDNWQVGVLSNSSSSGGLPIPVGMSKLVSNMLEAFGYVWKESHSPEQCIKLLESRLREMWLRSETLAEFLLGADETDAKVENLTNFLDIDAADLPLLLAVATTHTPQIAQRFGLTLF